MTDCRIGVDVKRLTKSEFEPVKEQAKALTKAWKALAKEQMERRKRREVIFGEKKQNVTCLC